MRRAMTVVAALVLVTTGCGNGGIFSTHTDRVAMAAGQELTAQRLADLLTANKNTKVNLTPESVGFVADLWVDFSLYAQALADKKYLDDSAFVAEAMWPVIAEQLANQWHDSLLARRAVVSDAAIDSAYKADQMRVGQHILILVDSAATPAQRNDALSKINGILGKLKAGGDFGALAMANSQDPGSAADSGYMAPAPKGTYVPEFEKVLWGLKPGEMSGVIKTEYGYHIVRLPTQEQASKRWKLALASSKKNQVDSDYFGQLEKNNDLKVEPGAVARMRAALADMEGKRNDKGKIVTYKGGVFTVADFVRWVKAASNDPLRGPGIIDQIKQAPDSIFPMFAKQLGLNTLMLKDAAANNVKMTPADWKTIQDGFKAELDTVQLTMGLGPQTLDPKASTSDREKAAALKVDQFFGDMVTGKVRLRFLPGMLPWALRERMSHKVSTVGLQRAMELAQQKIAADSAASANGTAGGGAIAPAPGPAPIGGAAPPPAPAPGGTKKP